MEIRTDSEYVFNGCTRLLAGESLGEWTEIDHGHFWQSVQELLESRPVGKILITKVKGHSTWGDVQSTRVDLQDKLGNDFADYLARQGASQHHIDLDMERRIINSKALCKNVQSMM
eukprot:8448654-Karenia_brevis.AAC.1